MTSAQTPEIVLDVNWITLLWLDRPGWACGSVRGQVGVPTTSPPAQSLSSADEEVSEEDEEVEEDDAEDEDGASSLRT